MAYKYNFSEQDLIELIGDDVSLPGSLAKLINDGGDIRSYFIEKLEEREEELARLHLTQDTRWMDKDELKKDPSLRDTLAYARSLGLHV